MWKYGRSVLFFFQLNPVLKRVLPATQVSKAEGTERLKAACNAVFPSALLLVVITKEIKVYFEVCAYLVFFTPHKGVLNRVPRVQE